MLGFFFFAAMGAGCVDGASSDAVNAANAEAYRLQAWGDSVMVARRAGDEAREATALDSVRAMVSVSARALDALAGADVRLSAEAEASRAKLWGRVGYGAWLLGDRRTALLGYYRARSSPAYPADALAELERSAGEVMIRLEPADGLTREDTLRAIEMMDRAYIRARADGDNRAAQAIGACRDRAVAGVRGPVPVAGVCAGPDCGPRPPAEVRLWIAVALTLLLGGLIVWAAWRHGEAVGWGRVVREMGG